MNSAQTERLKSYKKNVRNKKNKDKSKMKVGCTNTMS